MKLQTRILLMILLATGVPMTVTLIYLAEWQWRQQADEDAASYRVLMSNVAPVLSEALWNVDENGMRVALAPLFNAEGIVDVRTFDDAGRPFLAMSRDAGGSVAEDRSPPSFAALWPAVVNDRGEPLRETLKGFSLGHPHADVLSEHRLQYLVPLKGKLDAGDKPVGYLGLTFSQASLIDRFTAFMSVLAAGYVAFAVLCMGMLMWFFRRQIVVPVARLATASRAIAGGDLDTPVVVTSKDEIGVLGESFEEMRQRIRAYTDSLVEKNNEIQTTSAKLIEQTRLGLEMAENYNRTLESEVAARTSELVDTQQKLIASEKMAALGVFSAGMAHEINNPANFVSVGAQNAEAQLRQLEKFINDLVDPEDSNEVMREFSEHFSRIHESVKIVRLGISRIEAVISSLRATHPEGENVVLPVDVVDLAKSAWAMIESSTTTPIELHTQFSAKPVISLRVAEMNQVLIGLLTNAVHAIEDRATVELGAWAGTITLGVALNKGHVVVSVADNGAGVRDDVRDKLFDPFFTTKQVGRGSGLGLSMARDVVARHAGRIEFDSVIGRGTEFRIILPVEGGLKA